MMFLFALLYGLGNIRFAIGLKLLTQRRDHRSVFRILCQIGDFRRVTLMIVELFARSAFIPLGVAPFLGPYRVALLIWTVMYLGQRRMIPGGSRIPQQGAQRETARSKGPPSNRRQ